MTRYRRAHTVPHIVAAKAPPLIAGWLAFWLADYVLRPLAYLQWQATVSDTAAWLAAFAVVASLALCMRKSLNDVKKLALIATGCLAYALGLCLVFRFGVERLVVATLVIDNPGQMQHVTPYIAIVRDYLWPVAYGAALIAVSSAATLWAASACFYFEPSTQYR